MLRLARSEIFSFKTSARLAGCYPSLHKENHNFDRFRTQGNVRHASTFFETVSQLPPVSCSWFNISLLLTILFEGPLRSRCSDSISWCHTSSMVEQHCLVNNNHQSSNNTSIINLSTKCSSKSWKHFSRDASDCRRTQKRNECSCEKISMDRKEGKNDVLTFVEKTVE